MASKLRNRYPEDVKDWLIAETRARRKAGESLQTIGRDLAVPWKTLERWCSRRSARRSAFRRVEVVAPPKEVLVVHGAHGVRVEGLDVDGVAELLRRLG